jgi:tetratricopeptide (TPR) repeat protein
MILVGFGSLESVNASPVRASFEVTTSPAITQITPLLRPDQFDRATLMREANRYIREENYRDAEILFRKLIDRDPRDAALYYKLGIVLAAQYQDADAEAAYRRAIELEDRYVLALSGLGELYSSQSRWEEALKVYEQAVKIEASYTDAQLGQGQALWQLGRDREAVQVLTLAVEQLIDREDVWRAIAVSNLIQQIERMQDLV